jgi:MFS family permease
LESTVKRAQLALLIAVFFDMIGFTMLIPDIVFRVVGLLGNMGYKGFIVGVVLQSTFIVQLFASPIWGRVADQSSRKNVFILCQFLSALAMLIYGLAGSVLLLLVSRIIAGLGGANVAIAQAMSAGLCEEKDRKVILGRLGAVLSAGMIFGPAIGGILASHGGAKMVGLLGAAISVLGGVIVLIFVPNTPMREGTVKVRKLGREDINFLKKFLGEHPNVKSYFWIALVASFSLATLEGTFARLIQRLFGYGAKEFGFIFGYEALLGVIVSTFVLGWISKKLCDTSLLRLGYISQGIGLGLNPLAGSLVFIAPGMIWLFLASTLYAFGSGVVSPTLSSLASLSVSEESQGELFGIMHSARTFGFMIGPVVGGSLFDIHFAIPYALASLVSVGVAIGIPAICSCHETGLLGRLKV